MFTHPMIVNSISLLSWYWLAPLFFQNTADQDLIGPVEYFPKGGINMGNYPYLNQDGYLAPVVMARFTKPRVGALVQVWCKAWAKNIYHHKNDRAGSVKFELLVD